MHRPPLVDPPGGCFQRTRTATERIPAPRLPRRRPQPWLPGLRRRCIPRRVPRRECHSRQAGRRPPAVQARRVSRCGEAGPAAVPAGPPARAFFPQTLPPPVLPVSGARCTAGRRLRRPTLDRTGSRREPRRVARWGKGQGPPAPPPRRPPCTRRFARGTRASGGGGLMSAARLAGGRAVLRPRCARPSRSLDTAITPAVPPSLPCLLPLLEGNARADVRDRGRRREGGGPNVAQFSRPGTNGGWWPTLGPGHPAGGRWDGTRPGPPILLEPRLKGPAEPGSHRRVDSSPL
jgi:hypothetical protein